jgi:hypothetical protein
MLRKKRNAAYEGGASGSLFRKNGSPNSKAPRATQHFAIADGRDTIGVVDLVGGRYVARDLAGNTIGNLPTLKSAAACFDGGRAP